MMVVLHDGFFHEERKWYVCKIKVHCNIIYIYISVTIFCSIIVFTINIYYSN